MQSNAPDETDNEAEVSHSLFRFEHHSAPLLSRTLFFRRAAGGMAIGLGLLGGALGIGMIGYHVTEHMSWLDAFANAAMILSGMGPLAPMQTGAGKFFAGCYALFSGLAFITICGVVLAPFVHRLFHRFLLGIDDTDEKNSDR